jgi:hypothetical protein
LLSAVCCRCCQVDIAASKLNYVARMSSSSPLHNRSICSEEELADDDEGDELFRTDMTAAYFLRTTKTGDPVRDMIRRGLREQHSFFLCDVATDCYICGC